MLPLATSLLGLNPAVGSSASQRLAFDLGMDFTQSCSVSTDLYESDFLLYPYHWRNDDCQHVFSSGISQASVCSGLWPPVLLHGSTADILSPSEVIIPFDVYTYLNPCLIKGCEPKNAMASPFFIPDLVQGSWSPVGEMDTPSIGFCGIAAPLKTPFNFTKLTDMARLGATYLSFLGINSDRLLRRIRNNSKHAYRARLIRNLAREKSFNTSFILRDRGGLVSNAYYRMTDDSPYIIEYLDCINNNLYTICTRGTENYSVRFYETLCLGRIPILVDSDIVLPFDGKINYRERCIFIEPAEISAAAEIIAEWHYSRTAKQLEQIQASNRELWLTHLSHAAFYPRLLEHYQSMR
ncbi:exostosin domain-containing protein [Aphanothece microscopica]